MGLWKVAERMLQGPRATTSQRVLRGACTGLDRRPFWSRRDSIETQFGQDAVESLFPGGPSERKTRPEWTKWTQ